MTEWLNKVRVCYLSSQPPGVRINGSISVNPFHGGVLIPELNSKADQAKKPDLPWEHGVNHLSGLKNHG
jgi:hypothetical protein